jgi:CRISPR/Cas system-associated endonuclease Cas1
VFDLMEPLRPVVDRAVFGFVQQTTFAPEDFTLSVQGICGLNPELARRLVAVGVADAEVREFVESFGQRLLNVSVGGLRSQARSQPTSPSIARRCG